MTKTIEDINVIEWFSERKLPFPLPHFSKSTVPLTKESIEWISQKLTGRYYIESSYATIFGIPLFEDRNELMLYELTFG